MHTIATAQSRLLRIISHIKSVSEDSITLFDREFEKEDLVLLDQLWVALEKNLAMKGMKSDEAQG